MIRSSFSGRFQGNRPTNAAQKPLMLTKKEFHQRHQFMKPTIDQSGTPFLSRRFGQHQTVRLAQAKKVDPFLQRRSLMFGRPEQGTTESFQEVPPLFKNTVVHAQLDLTTGHRLEICQGDLTKEKTQAIVNTANEHLVHLGGLAHSIAKAGGAKLKEESETYVRQHGPIPIGGVAVTSAGSMGPGPIQYVIHAVSPAWHGGNASEEELMYTTVMNSLRKASELGVQSVALPCFSTGICRFPKDTCAKIFFRAIADFCKEQSNQPRKLLELIRVTNLDDITTRVFVRLLHETMEFDGISSSEVTKDTNPYEG